MELGTEVVVVVMRVEEVIVEEIYDKLRCVEEGKRYEVEEQDVEMVSG